MKTMLLVLGLLGLVQAAMADTPLDIKYGANEIDLNNDGIKDLIVRSRWDRLSAHSADKFSIIIRLPMVEFPEEFYEVENDIPDGGYFTSQGADCFIAGYTFALDKKGMLVMKYFHRRMEDGDTYSDTLPVTIQTFRIEDRRREELGGIGETPFFMKKLKEEVTKKKYCDVRELMK